MHAFNQRMSNRTSYMPEILLIMSLFKAIMTEMANDSREPLILFWKTLRYREEIGNACSAHKIQIKIKIKIFNMKMHLKAQVDKVREKVATLVLTALTAAFHAAGVRSTCEATNVNEGESATITCHFDNDIGKEELDVHVNRYNPDKAENVFRGAWFDGDFRSYSDPGVSLVDIVSNNLTLRIIEATKEKHAGTYMCQAALSGDNDTTSCTLIVSDIVNETQTSVMISLETTIFPNAENEMHQDVIRGLAILAGFILLLFMCILPIVVIKRRRKIDSRSKPWLSYRHNCGCSRAVCIYCTGCRTAEEEPNVTTNMKTLDLNDEYNVIDLHGRNVCLPKPITIQES